MKVSYAKCLIAALGIGMCATQARAQNYNVPFPTPPVASPAGQPNGVVPVSFMDEQPAATTCDTCNQQPACGCDCCDKCTGCCDCNNPSGYTFKWAPDKWANVSVGLRTTYNNTTDNLQPPGSTSAAGNFFAVNDARLLISGKVHEYIAFELNSELFGAGAFPSNLQIDSFGSAPGYQLLDAVIKFECDDFLHVWAGQFLPPSDRANLSGPFFINAWDFPYVQNYPTLSNGREVGSVYWGEAGGGMLQWSAGVFNGTGRFPVGNAPNLNGNPLQFAARVEANLLDPEPGYYKQGTYYGKKDILAFGFAIQTQTNALGLDPGNAHDFTGWNFDELFETKLDNDGVITLESAYYNYNTQGFVSADPRVSFQNSIQGQSGFVYAGYLLPNCLCLGCLEGRLRPFYRYLDYHHDNAAASVGAFTTGNDVGCDYIINGHNARLTAFWGDRNLEGGGSNINIFRVGAQIIF